MSASEMMMLEEELAELRSEVERLRSILADYEEMTDRLDAQAVGMTAAFDARDEEVERLRAEADLLRTGIEATRAYADRVEAELLSLRGERAAVVAWLREWQNTMDDRITHDDLDYAIAVIERGEHRREEKE